MLGQEKNYCGIKEGSCCCLAHLGGLKGDLSRDVNGRSAEWVIDVRRCLGSGRQVKSVGSYREQDCGSMHDDCGSSP